jgi:hypothetical protein
MKQRLKSLTKSAAVVFPLRSVDQAFVMALCLIFSLPVFFGDAPAPGSIEASMPSWMVVAWSVVLILGAGTVLGSYLVRDRIVGIIVEQFGSVCMGVAALFYSVAIFTITYDEGGAIPGAIVLGFAVTRFVQAYQYQKFLNNVRVVLDELERGAVNGR